MNIITHSAPCMTDRCTWCLFAFQRRSNPYGNRTIGDAMKSPNVKRIYRTLPKLTPEQYRKVRKLTNRCCNKDRGNCLLLDRGEYVPCIQAHSLSVNCKYFRAAVLPLDRALEAELLPRADDKRCTVCGARFRSRSSRAKYCRSCARKVKAKQDRISKRKQRLRVRI